MQRLASEKRLPLSMSIPAFKGSEKPAAPRPPQSGSYRDLGPATPNSSDSEYGDEEILQSMAVARHIRKTGSAKLPSRKLGEAERRGGAAICALL